MDDHHATRLTEAIGHLAREIHGNSQSQFQNIMSAISDFAAQMKTFNDRQDAAVTALQGDVQNLTAQIAALQATPGTITPEDQALLDGIQARTQAVADKLDALDALTPPVAPKA